MSRAARCARGRAAAALFGVWNEAPPGAGTAGYRLTPDEEQP